MATDPPTITIYDLPTVDQGRRFLDAVSGGAGRVATIAGAATAGVCLDAPGFAAGLVAVGTLTTTTAGLALLWLSRPAGHQRATAGVLYAMPGGFLTAILTAEQLTAQFHARSAVSMVIEAAATAVWAAAVWLLRPARTARRMGSPLPSTGPAAPETATIAAEPGTIGPRTHAAAIWWARNVAIEGGPGPGTILEDIESTGAASMRAIIRSATPGQPVPDIAIKRLSALTDIPVADIAINPVPGRGAGVQLLTIGEPDAADDPKQIWDKKIAPKAMPKAAITKIRVGPMPNVATGTGE